MQVEFKSETDANINIKLKRATAAKLSFVLYDRQLIGNSLTLELIFKIGSVENVIRRLTSFVGSSWTFVPNMDLPPEGNLIFRTIGGGAGDKHCVSIGYAE